MEPETCPAALEWFPFRFACTRDPDHEPPHRHTEQLDDDARMEVEWYGA